MANRFWVGDGGTNLWSGNCWSNLSGGAPDGGGPPVNGDAAWFDAGSAANCTMDVNSADLNLLDMNNYGAGLTFDQAGFTLTCDGDVILPTAGATFTHNNGLIKFIAGTANARLYTNGFTIGALECFVGGLGILSLEQNCTVAGNVTVTSGPFDTNGFSLTVAGTIFCLPSDTVTLGVTSMAALDCTGYTGTLIQEGTWTVTGTLFKLDAGMAGFTHNSNLVDFTATAGTVLITTAGFTIYDIRVGNGGAGGTYQLQDALTLANDLTISNGTWDSNGKTVTVTETLYFAGGNCTFDGATQTKDLDCTGATGTFTQGATLTITGTMFKLVAGMTFTHNNQLVDFANPGGTTSITSAGKTLGNVRFPNASSTGGTLIDALSVAQDLTIEAGTFDSNGQTMTISRDVFVSFGPTVTFGVMSCRNFDSSAATASSITQTGTWTISGTVFTLGGTSWFHNNNLIDFTATAGTVLITAGFTVGSVRFGNVGAGATYQPTMALTTAEDFTLVRGVFDISPAIIVVTIGRDLIVASTAGAGAWVSGASTVEIGRHFNIASTAAWHTHGTSMWRLPNTGTWTMPAGASNSLTFYDLYLADAGQTVTCVWQNSDGFVVNRRMTTGAGSFIKADASRSNVIQFNAGTSGISDQFHPDPNFTLQLSGAQMVWQTGGGAVPLTIDLYPCNFTVTINTSGGKVEFRSGNLTQNVTIRAMGNIVWNANNGFEFSYGGNDFGSGGAMSKALDTNGFNVSFLGSGVFNGRDAANGRAWWFNITAGNTLTVDAYNEYCPNAAANQVHVLGAGSTFRVNGNYTYLGGALLNRRYTLTATSVLSIGGSYSGAAMYTWTGSNVGIVRFTSAGAYTIVLNPFDQLPTVEMNGGGTVILPAGFNCYDLVAPNAVITINRPVTVRRVFTLGGTATLTATMAVGSGFVSLPGAVLTYGTGGMMEATGAGFTLDLSAVLPAFTVTAEVARLQVVKTCTVTNFIVEPRLVPLVIQLLAGGTFTATTFTNNVTWPDAPIQLISSTPGTQASLNAGAFTSTFNLWPRDINFTGTVITGNISNKNLGNVTGGSFVSDGQLRGITDDPGWDDLAGVDLGSMEYCWLVGSSLVDLVAKAAAFGTGSNNWHRRTRMPTAVLDNLNIGTGYFISYGLRDDRNRRVAPAIVAGGYFEGTAFSGSGGGGAPPKVVVTSKYTF